MSFVESGIANTVGFELMDNTRADIVMMEKEDSSRVVFLGEGVGWGCWDD